MELLFSVFAVLSLTHFSWAQITPGPGTGATAAGMGYSNNTTYQASIPIPWNLPQNDSYGTGASGYSAYSYNTPPPPPYDTAYAAYSTGSSSPNLDYLRGLINTMPRFKVEDVPIVLDLLRQKKSEMASLGQTMTAQDMGQVLVDFQASKAASGAWNPPPTVPATSGTALGTSPTGTSSLLSSYMNALSTGGGVGAGISGTTDPLSLLQSMQSAAGGGPSPSSPLLGGGGGGGGTPMGIPSTSLLAGGTTQPQTNSLTGYNSLLQQLQSQQGVGTQPAAPSAGTSPYSNLLNTLQGGGAATPTASSATSPLSNMLNLGGSSGLSALLQPQTSAATSSLAAMLQPQTAAAAAAMSPSSALASLLQPTQPSSGGNLDLASLLQPTQPASGGKLDLGSLLNSVTGGGMGGASSLLGGAGPAVGTEGGVGGGGGGGGGSGPDLLSILGIPNIPAGPGASSLLNSVLGGGSNSVLGAGGSGSALANMLGGGSGGARGLGGPLSGLGALGNAIGAKPRARPRSNAMDMMIPAMAMSSGMDGPWRAMAMAQAMRRSSGRGRGGMSSIMRNPMFLYNLMSGGEMFSF